MRPILLAAVLLAAAAPASADTVIWTGEVRVEKSVTDDGSEFYGYWHRVFGNIPGVKQFTFGGYTYTVDLFYITNTPRSLLAGAERRGSPGILPTDRGLAWLVDGQRFEVADHDRSFPDRGGGVGRLRARLAGRPGGVGAARTGGDTGSCAAGGRRHPARPGTARQGLETMTGWSAVGTGVDAFAVHALLGRLRTQGEGRWNRFRGSSPFHVV